MKQSSENERQKKNSAGNRHIDERIEQEIIKITANIIHNLSSKQLMNSMHMTVTQIASRTLHISGNSNNQFT